MTTSLEQWMNNTLAILVLYKMQLKDSPAFHSWIRATKVIEHLPDILIYDNSPAPDLGDNQLYPFVEYYHDPENSGVSKAYNLAFAKALERKKKWLLLLDQDSILPNNFFEASFEWINQYPDQDCFVPKLLTSSGLISPCRFASGVGKRVPLITPGRYSINKLYFLNSGLLISVKAFSLAGGYDEDLKLDFSDFAFVERLKKVITDFIVLPLEIEHSHSSIILNKLNPDFLKRFEIYIDSAGLFRKKYHPRQWLITTWPLLRAIKLSALYRSTKFIALYFSR